MKSNKKLVALICVVLLMVGAAGATLAWLTDQTDTVKNTFTTSDVDIELTESDDLNLKMVPGSVIEKDPKVTVKAGSEACWLFVEVTESSDLDFDQYMTWTKAEGWNILIPETVSNEADYFVLYREVAAVAKDTAVENIPTFSVLNGDEVVVLNTVTKDMMKTVNDAAADKKPTLKFKAYAVQKENINSVTDAWKVAQGGTI